MHKLMKISEQGLQKIMLYEGIKYRAYLDVAHLWTIGVGHLLTQSELTSGKIRIGDTYKKYDGGLTQTDCMMLLDQDCDYAENAVNKFVTANLNQDQFDSLVSFVFNVGVGAFSKSSFLKALNSGASKEELEQRFMRWVYAGGRVIEGLKNRRKKEFEAFK